MPRHRCDQQDRHLHAGEGRRTDAVVAREAPQGGDHPGIGPGEIQPGKHPGGGFQPPSGGPGLVRQGPVHRQEPPLLRLGDPAGEDLPQLRRGDPLQLPGGDRGLPRGRGALRDQRRHLRDARVPEGHHHRQEGRGPEEGGHRSPPGDGGLLPEEGLPLHFCESGPGLAREPQGTPPFRI